MLGQGLWRGRKQIAWFDGGDIMIFMWRWQEGVENLICWWWNRDFREKMSVWWGGAWLDGDDVRPPPASGRERQRRFPRVCRLIRGAPLSRPSIVFCIKANECSQFFNLWLVDWPLAWLTNRSTPFLSLGRCFPAINQWRPTFENVHSMWTAFRGPVKEFERGKWCCVLPDWTFPSAL